MRKLYKMKVKINDSEKAILQKEFDKGRKLALTAGLGMLIVSIILCLVPAGIIPLRKLGNLNPNASIFESLGLTSTLAVILLSTLTVAGIILAVYNYFSLKQDLKNSEKVVFKANVLKVETKSEGGEVFNILYLSPNKYHIVSPVLEFGKLPIGLKKGSNVEIHAAPASKNIFKIAEVPIEAFLKGK